MEEVMHGVKSAVESAADAAVKGVELEIAAIGEVWSLMESATEKRLPSEVMSRSAMQRMQGKAPGG